LNYYWALRYDEEKDITLAVPHRHENNPDKPWLDNKACPDTDPVDGEPIEFCYFSEPKDITFCLLTRGLGSNVIFQYEGKWRWASW